MQLVETKTFLYYGINDGDSIIALPKNAYIGKFDQKSGQFSERNNRFDSIENDFSTAQWLSVTRDNDTFNECMRWILNPNTAAEAARLRDMHLIKMEKKPKMMMKMIMQLENSILNDAVVSNSIPLKIDYDPLKSPSDKPLPILW